MKLTDVFMACLVIIAYNRNYKYKKGIAVCAAVYYVCRALQFII